MSEARERRKERIRRRVRWVSATYVDPGTLRAYGRDINHEVREAIAKNAACPPDVLQRLLVDRDGRVRSAASRHPGVSLALLEELHPGWVDWTTVTPHLPDDVDRETVAALWRNWAGNIGELVEAARRLHEETRSSRR